MINVIHHKDEDKSYNYINNLKLMDKSEHINFHNKGKKFILWKKWPGYLKRMSGKNHSMYGKII